MKNIVLFLIGFAVLAMPCLCEEQEEANPLFRIEQEGKWGYINKTGKVVIKPRFRSAYDFREGLAPFAAVEGGKVKWGIIDKSANIIAGPQFDYVGNFSEGLAGVVIDDKYGYIDKTGSFAIEPEFDVLSDKFIPRDFSEGLAAVYSKQEGAGCIDQTGRFVLRGYYPLPFSEGLAYTSDTGPCLGEYIDKTGRIVISREQLGCGSAHSFSEGLAGIWCRSRHQGKASCKPRPGANDNYGYIDKTGKIVIEPIFANCGGFSEGLAPVNVGDNAMTGKWSYIDKTGKMVIERQFVQASGFSEGLAAVALGGEWIKPETFTQLVGEKWGYIDRAGAMVIEPEFDHADNFHNGLAKVRFGEWDANKCGYIDTTGRFVWKSAGLRKAEWKHKGLRFLAFAIPILLVGLFVVKYKRSRKKP